METRHGLSQGTNAFVYRDSRGFVWISSLEGLNRFDGLEVKVYRFKNKDPKSIAGQNITSHFFEDQNGDIWFTTSNAINRYNRKTDDFSRWQVLDPETGDTLHMDYLAVFLEQDFSKLWVRIGDGESGRLFFFDTRSFKSKLAGPLSGNRFCVRREESGSRKWVYSFSYASSGPLIRTEILPDGQIGHRDTLLKNKALSNPRYFGLLLEGDTLWAAGSFGLAAFDMVRRKLTLFDKELPFKVNGICRINDHTLALTTDTKGLLFFDPFRRRIMDVLKHRPGSSSSISGGILRDVYLDREKTLWISDWNSGLNFIHLEKSKVRNVVLADLPSVKVNNSVVIQSIAEGLDGDIWCATAGMGVIRFQAGKGVRQFFCDRAAQIPTVYYLYPDRSGVVFAVTDQGIFWFDGSAQQFRLVENSDTLDVRNVGILARTLDEKLRFHFYYSYEIVANPSQSHFKLIQARDTLFPQDEFIGYWFQDARGDYYCSINDAYVLVVRSEGSRDTISGLGNLKGCWESPDGKVIWLATTSGLAKTNKKTLAYTLYDVSNGLPNQYLYSVAGDSRGVLWMSSNRGLIRFDPRKAEAVEIGLADGVWENECYSNAWAVRATGEIWFGNKDVLNIIHPQSYRPVSSLPQIQITEIRMNDMPLPDSLYAGERNSMHLTYWQNTLSFKFAALEYSSPAGNRLWYRMDAYDPDGQWLPVQKGAPGFARYAKLPPGNYTFQIRAANSDGVEAAQIKAFQITIQKPFFQEWWFIGLVLMAVAGMSFGFYQSRLNRLRKEWRLRQQTLSSEMKALRAQMDPHFLFNSLNSINDLVIKNELTRAREAIALFSSLVRKILGNSNHEVLPLEDEEEMLRAYLQVEQLRMGDKLRWELDIAPDIDPFETRLPSMILQPLVENAIWHGLANKKEPGHIHIRMYMEDDALVCTITDNGIGRKAAQAIAQKKRPGHQPQGANIVEERISLYRQKWGAPSSMQVLDLEHPDGSAAGTQVTLRIGQRRYESNPD